MFFSQEGQGSAESGERRWTCGLVPWRGGVCVPAIAAGSCIYLSLTDEGEGKLMQKANVTQGRHDTWCVGCMTAPFYWPKAKLLFSAVACAKQLCAILPLRYLLCTLYRRVYYCPPGSRSMTLTRQTRQDQTFSRITQSRLEVKGLFMSDHDY